MIDFYSIRKFRQDEASCSAIIEFYAGHDIFKGHFPSQPVVPGVCSVAIVKAMLAMALNKKLRLTSARQIKFLQLLTPDAAPHARISWTATETGYEVHATFELAGIAVLKLNCEMQD